MPMECEIFAWFGKTEILHGNSCAVLISERVVILIKERLKGLLALVLAGATALTTTTAVSAAESVTEGKLSWGGHVFLESDAIDNDVYQRNSGLYSETIDSDPAELAKEAGINDNFYRADGYTMGWGFYGSGASFNGVFYNSIIYFPYGDYLSKEHSIDVPITNELINEIGPDPSSGNNILYKMLVVNDVAKEFTIDYYDIFGDKKGTFVFSDGVQKLNGTDIFATGGENKKYILKYDDDVEDVHFELNLYNDTNCSSAWKLVTEEWSDDAYSGKTFDQSKLSLHRYANFSLNSSTEDYVNPNQIKEIKSSINKPDSINDLWVARYGYYGIEYLSGDQLADYLDKYNESDKLTIFNTGSDIYLRNGIVEQGEKYSWQNGELKRKRIKTIPYDLSQDEDIAIPEYKEIEWNLWDGHDASGYEIKAEELKSSNRKDEFILKDIKSSGYPLIEYKFVTKVYSVTVDGTDTLNVTVDDRKFPTGGGDYLFTYGDSVRKVVTSGEELWTEIAKVAKNYDSTKANLVKVQPITSAALNVEVPAIGGTPADAKTNSTQYEVTNTEWTPAAGKFAADTEYTVTAVIKPDMAFKFANNVTATVNGEPAKAVLGSDGKLTVTYTFAKIDPWDNIRKIDLSQNPVIEIPAGDSKIPEDVLEKIKNSGEIITIEYPDGTKWEIDGSSIDLDKIPSDGIDLSVSKVAKENWATVVNNVTGHKFRMQIDIAHSGDFGFTAYLVLDLSEGMTGISSGTYYANLYQVLHNSLEWSSSDVLTKDANGKWTAKLKFTHASEWLITIDDESNPKQNGGNSGGTSSGNGSSRNDSTKINQASTGKSNGWEEITKEIESANIGSTIKITLNDEPVITDAAAKAAASRRVKLVIDAGYGRIWNIDGVNLTGSLNLSMSGVNTGIPAEAYKDIACAGSTQFNAPAGNLGFTAQITIPVGKNNAGKNAALYRYNEASKKLEFVTLTTIGNDGSVTAGITRGGKYFVAYGDNVKAPENEAGTTLIGDLNGDGIVNAKDASLILRSLVEGRAIAIELGDFNKDGTVNAFDASAILKSVVNG